MELILDKIDKNMNFAIAKQLAKSLECCKLIILNFKVFVNTYK